MKGLRDRLTGFTMYTLYKGHRSLHFANSQLSTASLSFLSKIKYGATPTKVFFSSNGKVWH